jgi:hypothetical protein
MAILMLLTILVLSLLLGSLVREGMDGEAIQIVNEDAPSLGDPSIGPSDPKVTPDGIQLPNQEKPLTVDEITKILGSNQSIQQMLEKKETKVFS